MKIAHLILAHNNPVQLARLIARLEYPGADMYVHLDAKTPAAPFLHLQNRGNVFFVPNAVKVYWGSFSMVQATLNGFAAIRQSGINYAYVNLLSGQDYPLKPQQVIHDFLQANQGKLFMNYLPFDPDWSEAIPRVTRYHFNNWNLPCRYQLQQLANGLLPARQLPHNWAPVGRSQWFTIPMECVRYILDYWQSHPRLRRFMKLTWGPDEFMFQTILYNSGYQSEMVNNDLRYIDWSAGGASPKTLTMDDAGKLLASGKLFARKFDLVRDKQVLDFIDKINHDKKLEFAS